MNGNFKPESETPNTINTSSKISSQDLKKEPKVSNAKVLQNLSNPKKTYSLMKSNTFGSRKNSTQAKKMKKIMLSPSNNTLLKPRKSK